MRSQTESNHAPGLLADQPNPWLYRAVGLSAGAGLIHLMVAPQHFEEWIGYGLFFLGAAGVQLGYALLLAWKPNRKVLLAGIIGNGLIIGLYLITRTVGIPFFGPEAGEVEPIGTLDVISKIVEVALIFSLAMLLRTQPAPRGAI